MKNTIFHINAINEVINDFDFVKVESVMHFLNWKWYNQEEQVERFPRQYELKIAAFEMLYTLAYSDSRFAYVECGGFVAEKRDTEYTLRFNIEWSISNG